MVGRTLLTSESLAFTDPARGALAGRAFADALNRLGIADQLKFKSKLIQGLGSEVVTTVASGAAAIKPRRRPSIRRVFPAIYIFVRVSLLGNSFADHRLAPQATKPTMECTNESVFICGCGDYDAGDGCSGVGAR
jgi:hypothetical protein